MVTSCWLGIRLGDVGLLVAKEELRVGSHVERDPIYPEMIIESINVKSELIVLSSCGMSFMIGVTPGVDLGHLISVNGDGIERQDRSTVGFKTKLKLIRLFRANENLFIGDYYKDLRVKWMRGGV